MTPRVTDIEHAVRDIREDTEHDLTTYLSTDPADSQAHCFGRSTCASKSPKAVKSEHKG